MVETTDRTIGDTNSDVPRVIKRGSIVLSSYSAFGSLYRATGTAVLTDVLAANNPIIECYYYTSGGGSTTLDKMNYCAGTSTGTMAFIASYWLSSTTYNGKTVVQLNVEHIRTNQSQRTIYYIVYSSKFTNEVVF